MLRGKPPAPSHPSVVKRSHPDRERSGTLPEDKKFKFDPPEEPSAELPGTKIPDTFHFAVNGELTPSRVENIKAWVYTNRPERVVVWYDRGASLLSRINRKIIEKALVQSKDVTGSSGDIVLRERKAFYEAIRLARKTFIDNENITPLRLKGDRLTGELKKYLVDALNDNPDEVEAFLERQTVLKGELDRLSALPVTELIYDIPDNLHDKAIISAVKRAEFELGNLQQANDITTIAALDQEGGFGIDSRLTPALKDQKTFSKSNVLAGQLNLDERQKIALKYFKTQELLRSDPGVRVDIEGYQFPAYGSLLPVELKSQIANDVAAAVGEHGESAISDRLQPLDRSSLVNRNDALLMPDIEQSLSDRPERILASTKGATALIELKKDVISGLRWSRNYIKEVIDHWTNDELRTAVLGDFEYRIRGYFKSHHPQATKAEFDEYLRVVEGEYSATYLDLDRRGVLTGPVAWKRRATETVPNLSTSNPYTTAMAQEGTGGFNPFNHENLRSHDRQVIISVPNKERLARHESRSERFDPALMESDALRFNKHPESSYWLMVDENRQGKLVYVDGDAFIPGVNSRIVLSGHARGRESNEQANTELGGYSPKELAQFVFKVVGGQTEDSRIIFSSSNEDRAAVKSIVFKGCRLACLPSGSGGQNILPEDTFVVSFYQELKALNIDAGRVVVSSASVVTDPAGINAYEVISEVTEGIRLEKQENKPPLTVLEVTPELDADNRETGRFRFRTKPGTDEISSYQKFGDKFLTLHEFEQALQISDLSTAGEGFRSRLQQISSEVGTSELLVPADTRTVLYGMVKNPGEHQVRVVDASELHINGIKAAIRLAHKSANLDEWLVRLKRHFPGAADSIADGLSHFVDPEEAFKRLQAKKFDAGPDSDFVFKVAQLDTDTGASVVNELFPEPMDTLEIEGINLPNTCSPTKRSACSPEEIAENNEKIREAVSGLTLLSDDQTRILMGDSADDIALHPAKENSALSEVQKGIHDFRRSMATQRLRDHEGYHNIIALDEESLPAARDLAERSGDKARALLLDADYEVLLDNGRVVVMVEGGSDNHLSLVGSIDTLAMHSGPELAEQVKVFARDGTVGTVTVRPTLDGEESFDSAGAFDDLEVLKSDSPWRDVSRYVRLQPLLPTDDGGWKDSESIRLGIPGRKAGLQFDHSYLQQVQEGADPVAQPKAFEERLKQQLDKAREEIGHAEDRTFESITLTYARKMQRFRAEFDVFRAAMDEVYKNHSELTSDDMPLLSSLKQEGEGWKLTFSNRDAEPSSFKTVEFDDQRIVDFIHSYSDQLDQVRKILDWQPGEHDEIDPTEGAEMIDGLGLAMALQSVIEMVGHGRRKAAGEPLPPDYKRALEVHQAVGLAFGAVLDFVKYVAAATTGEIEFKKGMYRAPVFSRSILPAVSTEWLITNGPSLLSFIQVSTFVLADSAVVSERCRRWHVRRRTTQLADDKQKNRGHRFSGKRTSCLVQSA